MRATRSMAATLLLALALTALAGATASASAATPTPGPSRSAIKVLEYSGTSHTSATDPSYSDPHTYPAAAQLDCTQLPCSLSVTVSDSPEGGGVYSMNGGTPIMFTPAPGSQTFHIAEGDSPCDAGYFPGGSLTVTVTDTQISVTRTSDRVGEVDCNATVFGVFPVGYTISLTAALVSGSGCVAVGDCPTTPPAPTPTVGAAAAAPPNASRAVRVADPSTLSVLPTLAVAINVPNVIWAVAATLVLVLLIALPSHLLNTATEAGGDRVSLWWKASRARLRSAIPRDAVAAMPTTKTVDPPAKPVSFAGWPIAAAGVLAASLISSFIDPSFGFNAASIRVFLSILLSFLLDAVLGWFLLILFVRRANPNATARFRFAPASLVVVVIAVLFTRLTGFQPGIVFGLVAGVVFGAVIATGEKARLAMIGLGYSFVLAIIGWIGYSAIAGSAGEHPAAPLVFLQETLSAMAIGGIAALPIALVPLRGLAGHEIWRWNRWVWASGYAIGLTGFFIVLMPKPFSWTTVGLSVWTWAGIYLAYAIGSVVLWLIAARPWRKVGDDMAIEVAD